MDETLYDQTVAELMQGPEVLQKAVRILCSNRDAWKNAYVKAEQKMETMTRKLDSILNDKNGIVYRGYNCKE